MVDVTGWTQGKVNLVWQVETSLLRCAGGGEPSLLGLLSSWG